ncbi:hypothetical protein LCGC14_1059490 [marine sediment metagenome]|uniref:Uncharacterized protein n=1 Tax=marine sediment metagenome TaxID=412755 RepID=A0A0F9N8H7_9ZZZZ
MNWKESATWIYMRWTDGELTDDYAIRLLETIGSKGSLKVLKQIKRILVEFAA